MWQGLLVVPHLHLLHLHLLHQEVLICLSLCLCLYSFLSKSIVKRIIQFQIVSLHLLQWIRNLNIKFHLCSRVKSIWAYLTVHVILRKLVIHLLIIFLLSLTFLQLLNRIVLLLFFWTIITPLFLSELLISFSTSFNVWIQKPVTFHLVLVMGPPVQRELPSLSESHLTSSHSTAKWKLISVCVFMLL